MKMTLQHWKRWLKYFHPQVDPHFTFLLQNVHPAPQQQYHLQPQQHNQNQHHRHEHQQQHNHNQQLHHQNPYGNLITNTLPANTHLGTFFCFC